MWDQPEGGIHGYLIRFLESTDTTFQHIAIWTLVQLLESEGEIPLSATPSLPLLTLLHPGTDPTLEAQIRASPRLTALATQLSTAPSVASSYVGGGGDKNDRSVSERSMSDDGEDGEGEIKVLAKRVLDLLDGVAVDE